MGAPTFQNPVRSLHPVHGDASNAARDFFVRHLLSGSVSNAAAEPVAARVCAHLPPRQRSLYTRACPRVGNLCTTGDLGGRGALARCNKVDMAIPSGRLAITVNSEAAARAGRAMARRPVDGQGRGKGRADHRCGAGVHPRSSHNRKAQTFMKSIFRNRT